MRGEPATIRVLVIEDHWLTEVFNPDAPEGTGRAIAHLVQMATGITLSVTAVRQAGKVGAGGKPPRHTWKISATSGAESAEMTLGDIKPGFWRDALQGGPTGSWTYDVSTTFPVAVRVIQAARASIDHSGDVPSTSPGLWLRVDVAEVEGGPYKVRGRVERVEIFVVPYWPPDAMAALVGARNGLARFWNLAIIDNRMDVVPDDSVTTENPTVAPVFLFEALRTAEGGPHSLPDRRSQVIIEATTDGVWAPSRRSAGQTRWPWFSLMKDLSEVGYKSWLSPVPTPVQEEDVIKAVGAAFRRARHWQRPVFRLFGEEVGDNVDRLSMTDAPILLLGAPGSARSLVARVVHDLSHRHLGPFVVCDCAALPRDPSKAYATLFGREAGSDLGSSASLGFIQRARGGTLFLSSIERIPEEILPALAGLLRAAAYRPYGTTLEYPADLRVIASGPESRGGSGPEGWGRLDALWGATRTMCSLSTFNDGTLDYLIHHCFESVKAEFGGSGPTTVVRAHPSPPATEEGTTLLALLTRSDSTSASVEHAPAVGYWIGPRRIASGLTTDAPTTAYHVGAMTLADASRALLVKEIREDLGTLSGLYQRIFRATADAIGETAVDLVHLERTKASQSLRLNSTPTTTPKSEVARAAWVATMSAFKEKTVDEAARALVSYWNATYDALVENAEYEPHVRFKDFKEWLEGASGVSTGDRLFPRSLARSGRMAVIAALFDYVRHHRVKNKETVGVGGAPPVLSAVVHSDSEAGKTARATVSDAVKEWFKRAKIQVEGNPKATPFFVVVGRAEGRFVEDDRSFIATLGSVTWKITPEDEDSRTLWGELTTTVRSLAASAGPSSA